MPTSLIADPDLPYAELAARLRALGWEWRRESQRMPILPGEPEWVIWVAGEPPTTLVYTFNPAVRLRVLAFSGESAAAQRDRTAAFLPHLTSAEIAELLGSEDTESTVLGLMAAEELGLAALLPTVEVLTGSADDFIAEVAVRVAGNLLRDVAATAREYLADQPTGANRLAGFAGYACPAIRRQVIRTAGRDLGDEAEIGLEFLLRAGLADPDWEVRASALLVAGRRGLRSLADAAAATALPADGRFGHTETELRRFELLRSAVLGHLRRQPPENPAGRHARRCVLGENDGVFDRLYLLVHALTVPLELDLPPERLPPAVIQSYAGPILARSRLPLSWVAPVPCWLGEGDAEGGGEVPNPLRRVVPRSGFFMARRPLPRSQVEWVRAGGPGDAPEAPRDAGYPCSFDEARRLVDALSAIEGANLVLPTADQWEIAARGPDGRRYPWGNGLEPEPERRLSPWGIEGMAGGMPQWTRTVEGGAMFCGGPALPCAARTWPSGPGLVRPILVAR